MTLTRRRFLTTTAATAAAQAFAGGATAWAARQGAARLTPRARVDRALAGRDVDRPPISLWHHFGLEKEGPARHAATTLAFHRDYRTDLVKVMSDFPFPKPAGAWHEVKALDDPFPLQIQALTAIRDGLQRSAHFVETIFNPWNVAEKLSSPQEVQRLKAEQPQKLLDALEAIARSEATHARRAMNAGASGIFLAIANAQPKLLSREDYARFSAPFDRMVLDAVKDAPLNVLHLHGDAVYLDGFYTGWPAAVINYSAHGTGVALATARAQFAGVLAGGIDETKYRTLDVAALKAQADDARRQAGAKFILTPGCSVPDPTPADELRKLAAAVGA
jgi:uroporphyrinogen decarboxylase